MTKNRLKAANDSTDLRRILGKIRIPKKFSGIRPAGPLPVAIPSLKAINAAFGARFARTDAEPYQILDARGKTISQAIKWTCVTDNRNLLYFAGSPFVAQELHWYCENIRWTAGQGWPVYTTYCPRSDPGGNGFLFHNALKHQIVPVFGGVYWVGCYNPAWGRGASSAQVEFWVNDDSYPDVGGGQKPRNFGG